MKFLNFQIRIRILPNPHPDTSESGYGFGSTDLIESGSESLTVRLSKTACVVPFLKWEFTINFDSEQTRKVVHTVTGADSYWSMLRKSHLKYTQNPRPGLPPDRQYGNSLRTNILKVLTNKKKGGLKVGTTFDRSPLKLFTLRFSKQISAGPHPPRGLKLLGGQ
jgi:hypothetical protein